MMIRKISKASLLSDWVVEVNLSSEESVKVPIRNKSKTYIGPTLRSLIKTINDLPEKYPFEYNMVNVRTKENKECTIDILNSKINSLEIPLTTFSYIKNNIKQTNWVSEKLNIKTDISFEISQTFNGINENAIIEYPDYTIEKDMHNQHRFWLILEKESIEVLPDNIIKGYISGYAWPNAVKVPEKVYNFNFKNNHLPLKLKMHGVKNFVPTKIKGNDLVEKYQLPLAVLEEIDKEAHNFNNLLIRNSNIVAISLQYNVHSENFVIDEQHEALKAFVFTTDYKDVEEALESIQSNTFSGNLLNTELLKPLYSGYKTLLEEYQTSQPMPVALFDVQENQYEGYGIAIDNWIEDYSLANNPIQLSNIAAVMSGNVLNDIDYELPVTDATVLKIAQRAKEKILKQKLALSKNQEHHLNNSFTRGGIQSSGPLEDEVTESLGDEVPEDANNETESFGTSNIYINNKNNIVPYDDRMYSGEIYSKVVSGREELPLDYTNKVRIGDVFLPISPTSIRVDKQYQTKKSNTMRAKSSLQVGVANTRNILTLNIYFADLEDINGSERQGYIKENGEEATYYMDGLRPLIAQFKKAPFLPIDNEYINLSLKIHNVVLRNLYVETVPGFPEALKATLILEEFDLKPYLFGESQLGALINYPLLRYHYQRSLHEIGDEVESYKTYLPTIDKLSNHFTLSTVDENELSTRNQLAEDFRKMMSPAQYKLNREQELQGHEMLDEDGNFMVDENGDVINSIRPKEIKDPITSIEKDIKKIEKVIRELDILKEEARTQEIAAEYGLAGKYTSHWDIPIIPGGYYNYDWDRSEEEVAYGHRMAVELWGEDPGYADSQWLSSKVPNPGTDLEHLYLNKNTSMYVSEQLMADELQAGVHNLSDGEIRDRGATRGLPNYKNILFPIASILDWFSADPQDGWFFLVFESKTVREELYEQFKLVPGHLDEDVERGIIRREIGVTNRQDEFIIFANKENQDDLLKVVDKYKNMFKDIYQYEEEYNDMLDQLNNSENELPMVKYNLNNIIPISMTIGLENNFSAGQVQAAETPTMQFFGALDPEIMIQFETDETGVLEFEAIFRKIGRYAKQYREGIVSGFLGIENNLINMFDIDSILPTSIQYETIENHPERRVVTITASGFNKTQRRQEAIYGALGGNPSDEMKDRAYNKYNPTEDSYYVHKRLKQLELYPDLEMPQVSELQAVMPSLSKQTVLMASEWPNPTGQVFLDPDFYVTTNETLANIANNILSGDTNHEVRKEDTTGYVMDTIMNDDRPSSIIVPGMDEIQGPIETGGPDKTPSRVTMTNFVATGKTGVNFEEEGANTLYSDSNLLWENYGNEHKFKPVIIGVTHGDLSGGGSNFNNSNSDYGEADLYGGEQSEIPNEILEVPTRVEILTNSTNHGGHNNALIGITLHDTGNKSAGANARMHHDYQAGGAGGRRASWHYSVDDKEAIQSFEHRTICWHAGDGTAPRGGNTGTIGIEMCINSDGNFAQSVNNTAALMAALCYVYDWDPNKDIYTHQDWDGKYCPQELLNNRDGWNVQSAIDLTVKKLDSIKAQNSTVPKTPTGGGTVRGPIALGGPNIDRVAKYVNSSHILPTYSTWLSWDSNKEKTTVYYNNWINNIQSNFVDQKELWFKINNLIIKYFGPDLISANYEIENIIGQRIPYHNSTGTYNYEEAYLPNTALGILSFTSSDDYYSIKMKNLEEDIYNKLKNGRKIKTTNAFSEIIGTDELSEYDSLQRISHYIKALISVESGGLLYEQGQPILKDKNALGQFTKGGFAGAKLTSGVSKEEAERLLWDWEYNLEHVIKELSDIYHLAKRNKYKEIRMQALDWAIASRSWIPLPEILYLEYDNNESIENEFYSFENNYDNHMAYDNGKIDPSRNPFWKEVELLFQLKVAAYWSQDQAPILYIDLNNYTINSVYAIYKGLAKPNHIIKGGPDEDKPVLYDETSAEHLILSDNLRKYAEREVAEMVAGGTLPAEDADAKIQEIYEEEIGKYYANNTDDEYSSDDLLGDALSGTDEKGNLISQNNSTFTAQESIKGMYVDMLAHDHTGRLIRAFPTFIVQLIDEGEWYSNFRMWDNFYGYNAIKSIDVYKSRKIVADTAVIEMSNMYSGLTSKKEDMGYKDLNRPSFFSNIFWNHYILDKPDEEMFEQRKNLSTKISLKAGARLHVRMGYGADPFGLPIVFNGVISEVDTGEIVTIVAQGDGIELTNAMGGDKEDTNSSILKGVHAPRDVIGKIMTSKGSWFKDIINDTTNAYVFKDLPSGIAHFGSTIHSEDGNAYPFNDDYGESAINVYSNNGLGEKSQFINSEGHKISIIENMIEYTNKTLSEIWFEEGGSFDEQNILISLYGASLWDIVQTFALASQDYHAAVVPFEYRSTLFFGKNHWPLIYQYKTEYTKTGRADWQRSVLENGYMKKTFMQAHIVTSQYNIIQNNFKASAEGVYNNVVVEVDGHTSPIVQADADIKYDQQRTAYIEGSLIMGYDKGLMKKTRNFFTKEVQAMIYGQSTVRDFMKDMYKGNYTIIGDASIKPHDFMFMSDTIQGLQGIHLVKAVHHSMSLETGFISIVEPDAYVVNFDLEGLAIAELAWAISKKIAVTENFASIRPSDPDLYNRIYSQENSSAVLSKMLSVFENSSSDNISDDYLAAIMRKTQGIYFNAVADVLGDSYIRDLALNIYNNKEALSMDDLNKLYNYLADLTSENYSESIKKQIDDSKARASVTDKVRYNHKQYFAGINMEEYYKSIVEGARETAKDTKDFWTDFRNHQVTQFLNLLERNPEVKTDYDNYVNNNPNKLNRDQYETIKDFVYKNPNDKTLDEKIKEFKYPSGPGFAKSITRGYNFLMDTVMFPVDFLADLITSPIKMATSSLHRVLDSKRQNAECVKVIPMNYKGTELLAAMEGRRGGVWGDTPSPWDEIYEDLANATGDNWFTRWLDR